MKIRKLSLFVSLLVMISPVGLASMAVSTALVENHVSAPVNWLNGTVISKESAQISSEVRGRIIWVADFGAQINKGGLLAKIDGTELKLEAEHKMLQKDQALQKFSYLSREAERLQALHKKKSISRNKLDAAQHDARMAELDWQLAKVNFDKANDQLERSEVRAPFSGVVNERMAALGEYVTVGDKLVELVNTEQVEVQVQIPIGLSHYLTSQETLQILNGENSYQSQLINQGASADSRSRLIQVRLNPGSVQWAPGTPVKVAIPLSEPVEALRVPRDAIVISKEGQKIYKVLRENDEHRAFAITVDVLFDNEQYAYVSGKIHAGDHVVVRGNHGLKTKDVVIPVEHMAETDAG
ncbi:efflux RND transporter periplasmic adaptor subunit [uncultured Endozoicomonas sp.]|uniref:efflux RND transporter periplasmic adaptor subunit n=1 Tax=uncultured Endozoicomonas sp. TaxID=432652 RepID=UPI002626E131|nr:efflux RND transporter periplasmic adaptor subunit [uncultured Endozoicomonas sp.]